MMCGFRFVGWSASAPFSLNRDGQKIEVRVLSHERRDAELAEADRSVVREFERLTDSHEAEVVAVGRTDDVDSIGYSLDLVIKSLEPILIFVVCRIRQFELHEFLLFSMCSDDVTRS